jgi:hypothetical protein
MRRAELTITGAFLTGERADGFFVFLPGRHLPNQFNLLSAKLAALSLTSAAALP